MAGFTTGSGNELIVNLGLITSLVNGEQWNLATLLGTGSGNAGFANLNNLNWGVLGISASQYYSTTINNTAAKGNAQMRADCWELPALLAAQVFRFNRPARRAPLGIIVWTRPMVPRLLPY